MSPTLWGDQAATELLPAYPDIWVELTVRTGFVGSGSLHNRLPAGAIPPHDSSRS